MSLFVNGTEVTKASVLQANSVNLAKVYANGVLIWEKYYGLWSGSSVSPYYLYGLNTTGGSWRFRRSSLYGSWQSTTMTYPFGSGISAVGGRNIESSALGLRVKGEEGVAGDWIAYTPGHGFEEVTGVNPAFYKTASLDNENDASYVYLEGSSIGELRYGYTEDDSPRSPWITLN